MTSVVNQDFYIEVNDIFDELNEENKRLNNELMFANNCLNIFNKFKLLLNKIWYKFETNIDFDDKQVFNQLEEEFNSVIEGNQLIKVTNIKTEYQEIDHNLDNLNNHLSEDNSTPRSTSVETNVIESNPIESLSQVILKSKTIPKNNKRSEALKRKLFIGDHNYNPRTGRYVCPELRCNKSFETTPNLRRHYSNSHRKTKHNSCDDKSFDYLSKQLSEDKSSKLTISPSVETIVTQSDPIESINLIILKPKTILKNSKTSEEPKTNSFIGDHNYDPMTESYVCPKPECKKSFHSKPNLRKHFSNSHRKTKSNSCVDKNSDYLSNQLSEDNSTTRIQSSPSVETIVNEIDSNESRNDFQIIFQNKPQNERPKEAPILRYNQFVGQHNYDPTIQSYVCPIPECKRPYRTRRSLTNHHRRVHRLTPQFACPYKDCNKCFKTRSHMLVHTSRIHKQDMPYVCHIEGCPHKFKYQRSLLFHLNTHPEEANKSTEPVFKCLFEGCNQVFNKKCRLVDHRRLVHNPRIYRCDWPGCNFEHRHPTRFRDHRYKHTGEKPQVCDWAGCGQRFRTNGLKFRHIQIHKNERRYVCDWPGCEYRANVCSELAQHKKWNHKLKPSDSGGQTQPFVSLKTLSYI